MPSKDTGSNIKNLNTEGQGKRQKNEIAIQDLVTQLCPMEYNKLVATLSREMHLAPDTIKYSFLNVLFYTEFIHNDQYNIVYLTKSENIEQSKTEESQKEESFMEYVKKHPHGTCKNCGKPTFNTDFCSKECTEEYKTKEESNK